MRASRRILFLLIVLALLLLFLAVPGVSWADIWGDGARQLAGKISASVSPGQRVALTLRNFSSLGAAEVAQVRSALEAELRGQDVRLVEALPSDVDLRVTLSENMQGYLWVAEIRRGETQEVRMLFLARPAAPARAHQVAPVVVEKRLLWEQGEPMLDRVLVGPADGAEGLLVLEPKEAALYEVKSARGKTRQSVPLASPGPWPRDLHGRLAVEGNLFWAYLPGMVCGGIAWPALSLDCKAGHEPWPLRAGGRLLGQAEFAAGRNFFGGQLVTGSGASAKLPPFFSAAAVEEKGGWLWIFAGLDGRAQLYEKSLEPAGTLSGWGSDIASVRTGCGSGWQVLATKPGDATEPDTVQAYEIVDRRAGGPAGGILRAGDGAAVGRKRKHGGGTCARSEDGTVCSVQFGGFLRPLV